MLDLGSHGSGLSYGGLGDCPPTPTMGVEREWMRGISWGSVRTLKVAPVSTRNLCGQPPIYLHQRLRGPIEWVASGGVSIFLFPLGSGHHAAGSGGWSRLNLARIPVTLYLGVMAAASVGLSSLELTRLLGAERGRGSTPLPRRGWRI